MAEMWARCLVSLTSEEVDLGFRKFFKSADCSFPPKPGEIIQLSGFRERFEDAVAVEERRIEAYRGKQKAKGANA